MRVLVTGGAGYIGSHAVHALVHAGHEPIVLDSLTRGHRAAVPPEVPLVVAELRDTTRVEQTLREHGIEGVLHFAALTYVGESVEQPLAYYDNNVGGALSLLRAMSSAGVRRIVFSSTCATYGEPPEVPIPETTPQNPINPYGQTKLVVEHVLRDLARSDSNFAYAALRYFNVAGCARDGSLGEDHRPETHLIPILLQVALGQRAEVTVFGEDYPTPDGTCIRDYIHVEDLVAAHLIALTALDPGRKLELNLGLGHGYSVKEVLESARRVTGHPIPARIGPRRPGDPAALYAQADRVRAELGWKPELTSLDDTIASAWRWFREHPRGYGE